MKKWVLFCLAVLLLISVIAPGSAASSDALRSLMAAEDTPDHVFCRTIENAESLPSNEIRRQLSLAGGTLEQIRMSGFAKANDSYLSLSDLEEFAAASVKTLGSSFNAETKSNESERIRQVNLQSEQAGVGYMITFQNEEFAVGNEYETYLFADAVLYDVETADESEVLAVLEKLLSLFAKKPCIRTTYTAAMPGQLDTGRMEAVSRQIFRGMQGKITEEVRDGGWISKTGYSGRIACAMESNGKWINLNVALRYNEYEDKTYVWLGTPVISIPY